MIFAVAGLVFDPLRHMGREAAQSIERHSRAIRKDSVLAKMRDQATQRGEGPEKSNKPWTSGKEVRMQSSKVEASRQRASDISFWLRYICLEVPARKVAYASYLLKKEKTLSPKTVGAIVLGILMSPAFAIAWSIQRVICHASYLIQLLRTWAQKKPECNPYLMSPPLSWLTLSITGLAHKYHQTKAPRSSPSADEGKQTYEMYLHSLTKPPEPIAWIGSKRRYLIGNIERIEKTRREQQKKEEEMREKEKQRRMEKERRRSRSTSRSRSRSRSRSISATRHSPAGSIAT